ncbi:MAG TPA: ABC transporter permease [Acidimicrobiia bacterium]|nr:ABC transporter permease [Acidimicrobiia bacterium]
MSASATQAPTAVGSDPLGTRTLRWLRKRERILLGVLGVIAVLGFWEFAVVSGWIRTSTMSSPTIIVDRIVFELDGDRLIPSLWVTLRAYLIGLALATVVGIPLGFLGGWSKRASYVLEPWLAGLNATPTVALVPLILIWLGIGQTSKVFIVFLFAIFPYAFNTMIGVRQSEAEFLGMARSFGASQPKVITSIVLPGAVPYMMTAARLAVGRALIGVVVAELVASNTGLGFLISIASGTFDTPLLMVSVLFVGVFGLIMTEVMKAIERQFDKWRPELTS